MRGEKEDLRLMKGLEEEQDEKYSKCIQLKLKVTP